MRCQSRVSSCKEHQPVLLNIKASTACRAHTLLTSTGTSCTMHHAHAHMHLRIRGCTLKVPVQCHAAPPLYSYRACKCSKTPLVNNSGVFFISSHARLLPYSGMTGVGDCRSPLVGVSWPWAERKFTLVDRKVRNSKIIDPGRNCSS